MSVYKYYVPNAIEIDHFSVNTYPLGILGKFNDIDIFQTNLYIKNQDIIFYWHSIHFLIILSPLC